MVGFITAPLGEVGQNGMDLDTLPSTAWDRADPLGTIDQIGRAIGRGFATTGAVDDLGNPVTTPEPNVPADVLNDKYRIAGPTPETSLSFDRDMPDSVAAGMYDAKRDANARANAAQRAPSMHGLSTLADLGFGFLDPVGLAASAMPVFGEGRIAALLGRAGLDLGEGAAGRLALRAATGAADATAATAPLVALRYGLSQQDGTDYGMYDAAQDLAFGGLMGGVLHPLVGGILDLARSRTLAGSAAQMQAATAAVIDDRPVDVGGVRAPDLADLTLADAAAQLTNAPPAAGNADAALGAPSAADGAPGAGIADMLGGAGQAIGDNLRDALWAKVEAGDTTEGGVPSNILLLADAVRQGGGLPDRAAFDPFYDEVAPVVAARAPGWQARAVDLARQHVPDLPSVADMQDSASARQAAGQPAPDDARLQRQAADAAKLPPDHPGAPPELTQQIAQLEDALRRADEAGALDPALRADLAAADAATAKSGDTIQAIAQATACLLRGI